MPVSDLPTTKDLFVQRLTARVRAVVLLGGSIRPSRFGRAIDRSLLDLPVTSEQTILGLWQAQTKSLGETIGRPDLPLRVLIDPAAKPPTPSDRPECAPVEITRDRGEYRGTGGVLGDLGAEYTNDDLLLVANAAQILIEDLDSIVRALVQAGGDLSLVGHDDGTPVGVMLLSVRAMAAIPEVGFIDFKEQVLPRLAKSLDVKVVARPRATGIPVRLTEGYLAALRTHHRRLSGGEATTNPFEEDWVATFSVVEPGALVAPGAKIHDSVVLRGGRVEANAVVVRSVIASGGIVQGGTPVADRLVSAEGEGKART